MAYPTDFEGRRRAQQRRRRLGLLLALLIAIVLVGLVAFSNGWGPFGSSTAAQQNPGPAPAPAAQGQVVRLQGSNTIGAQLAPNLAKAFLTKKGATDVAQTSTTGLVTVTGTLPSGPARFEIRAEGTETAFRGMADGSTDIGMASRRITDAEKTQLSSRGDLTAASAEHVIGIDAIAILVNQGSRATELSLDQVRQAFTCQVTDWAQLAPGLAPGPIKVLARDANSGTFETFEQTVLGGAPLCPSAQRFASNQDLSTAVANDQNAIGFAPLPFIGNNHALALYDGGSKPTAPSSLSVSTETYLLTRRLYLYVPPTPPNALAQEFADTFALSPDGQKVVVDAGFVSSLFPPPAPPNLPCAADVPEYCKDVAGATRVPFDVRFDSGTDELDNRATRNLDLLAAQTQPGRQVLLVGFADNSGDPQANVALSKSRAASVASYLAGKGLRGAVVDGFGSALPVDTNDTPEGREQNRRVEVWTR
jgi:phosphate transport system substrate-binding protein